MKKQKKFNKWLTPLDSVDKDVLGIQRARSQEESFRYVILALLCQMLVIFIYHISDFENIRIIDLIGDSV